MNPIQKAWLKVLTPVATLVNDKLAKRSGMLGKIGKFFAFGPRQFGFHPINKFIALWNRLILETMGIALHQHSLVKHLSLNGFVFSRPFAVYSLLGKWMIFTTFLIFLTPTQFEHEDGTTLEHLSKRGGLNVPYNALNQRTSAHFTEINSIYAYRMMKFASAKYNEIQNKWNRTAEKQRKTRFARSGYQYIEPHTKAIE